jgi:hypothetical protein
MAVIVQYVSKPNQGADTAKIIESAKESAALWRKHGGEVSYWTVTAGEVGNFVFAVRFENYAAYGAAMDNAMADPAVQAWLAKRQTAGLASWVRMNVAKEIEI